MSRPPKTLSGLLTVLISIAGFLLLFGGRAIHAFWGIGWLAEIVGLGLGVVFLVIAINLKNVFESDEGDED